MKYKKGQVEDLVNQKFGALTAIKHVGFNKSRNAIWLVKCDCGKCKEMKASSFKRGHSITCGCAIISYNNDDLVYGKRKSEYMSWLAMKYRCYNKSHPHYSSYGGRGIKVCDRWRNNFDLFAHDMGNKKDKSYSVERKDNNKDYSPDNCRRATQKEQQNNTRNNRRITISGGSYALAQAADRFKVDYMLLYHRINRGWEPHKAVFTPKRKHKK